MLPRWALFIDRPVVATFPASTTYGPRMRRCFDFVWLTAGTLHWSVLDGRQAEPLRPGTLALAPPGVEEYLHFDLNRPTTAAYVAFDVAHELDHTQWPLTRPIAAAGPFNGLLDYLLWLSEEPTPAWRTHVEQTLTCLLSLFVTAPLPSGELSREPAPLTAAINYIRWEWQQQVRSMSLRELARAASVSKEHLARLFREHYGLGFIKALELVRLSRAEALLTRTSLRISEIADSCGYQDSLYFSRRFHLAYGTSPQKYREDTSHHSPLATTGLLPLARRVLRNEH